MKTLGHYCPTIYQALQLRSVSSQVSVSALVDDAVQQLLCEDREDLAAFVNRKNEPEISYDALLADLERRGKLS